jgi:segregation and condensation protein B
MSPEPEPTQEAVQQPAAPEAAADQAESEQPAAGEQERRARIKRILEALLFSSDRPLHARQLAEAAGAADGHEARSLLKEMQAEYDGQGRAFALEEVAGGFQLMSRPEFAPFIGRLHEGQQRESLSKAALETLAIIAYRQPITRAAIEDIRGVQCGPVLRTLVDRRLARVSGRSEELGRPLLYGTTSQFLQVFGLSSLSELPKKKKLAPPKAEG